MAVGHTAIAAFEQRAPMKYMGGSTRRRKRRIVDGMKCTKYDWRGEHYQQATSTVVRQIGVGARLN